MREQRDFAAEPDASRALIPLPDGGRLPDGNRLPEGAAQADAVQEKVNEYRFLVAPVEQAIAEMERVRRMLQARTEEEINELSPALAALSETLNVSTLELLMARDRAGFVRDALARSGVPLDVLARRIVDAGLGAREQLEALGLPDSQGDTQ